MFASTGQRAHLGHHRGERLVGWVGVDRLLAVVSSPGAALDVPSQEVETLVDVADPRLGFRQAKCQFLPSGLHYRSDASSPGPPCRRPLMVTRLSHHRWLTDSSTRG